MQHIQTRGVVAKVAIVLILIAGVFAAVPNVQASHVDFEARRAQREAEREARRLERETERTTEAHPECTCSATLSFAKPSLSFGPAGLVFIPRVNVGVRLRGDQAGPKHTVSVHYEGGTSYQSDDVSPPSGINFSGDKTLLTNASCEGRWNFDGVELNRITLPGLVRTLVGAKQELVGNVSLKAAIAGCGFEEESRQFSFTAKEFGNLRVGSWRSVR